MVWLHCNYSDLLAQERALGQLTTMHRGTMDFYKKVDVFEVRGPGSHLKTLSILIKLGMYIAIWFSCIVFIATCWHKV